MSKVARYCQTQFPGKGQSKVNSGANGRVIKIINFLTTHPEESFNVSELSERLDISFGSTHRVLTALTQAGYLYRHPKHKTYSLGLALLAIGQVAMGKHQAVAVAQQALQKLADEFHARFIISAITHNEILYLATVGAALQSQGATRCGDRRPFIPPLGLCHVAWANRDARTAYLQRAPAELSNKMRSHVERAFDLIRQRGYSMGAMYDGIKALRKVISDHVDSYHSSDYWSALEQAIGQLTEQEIQLLSGDDVEPAEASHISVPVFSPTGEVSLELTMRGIPPGVSAPQLETMAERMVEAAAHVTRKTYGRKPKKYD